MKVSTDYDYESDQDENNKKKRKNKYYSDEEFVANSNINNKTHEESLSEHSETSFDKSLFKRKSNRQRHKKLNSDDEVDVNGDDDSFDKGNESDEDYNSDNESHDGFSKKVPKARGRKRKSRIDDLINSDENTSSNDGIMKASQKLTFDQYVKILTGNPNVSNTNGTSTATNVMNSTTAANASKLIKNINIDKLKVPIINPVVAAVLEANKLKQQQPVNNNDNSIINTPNLQTKSSSDNDLSPTSMPNVDNLTKSIEIIGMPNAKLLSPNNGNSKRLVIINSNPSQAAPASITTTNSSVLTSSSLNLIKIINLSQPQHQSVNSTPIKILSQTSTGVVKNVTAPIITPVNRKIIVINNNNQQNVNSPQVPTVNPMQSLTKICNNTPTQLIKITTNQNSQPSIQTITKLATTSASIATTQIAP